VHPEPSARSLVSITVTVVVAGPDVLVVDALVVVEVGAVVVVVTGAMVVEVDVVSDTSPSPQAANTNVTPVKRTKKRRLNSNSFRSNADHTILTCGKVWIVDPGKNRNEGLRP